MIYYFLSAYVDENSKNQTEVNCTERKKEEKKK